MKIMDFVDSSYFSHTMLIVVALIFYVYTPGFPVQVTPQTRDFVATIDSLEPGSTVLVVYTLSVSDWPVLGPAVEITLRHVMERPLNVMIICTTADGPQILDRFLGSSNQPNIKEMEGREYGEDWVNVGFIPGGEVMYASLGSDIHGTVVTDVQGTPIADVPMMENIKIAEDIDLVIMTSASSTGVEGSVRVWGTTFDRTLIGVISGGEYPSALTYYPTMFKGLLNGLKGGGEYETLLKKPGPNLAETDPLTGLLFMNVLLLILGNVLYYAKKYGMIQNG